jgi:DNA-binding NarL/FixJ family response regulator
MNSTAVSIMIVEDHKVFRQTVRTILNAHPGFLVIAETGDSDEAISLAETLHPHIILMDISIKPISGIALTEKIRRLYPAILVIGLSMFVDADYAIKMLRAGASGYVTKTSSPREIVDSILKVVSGGTYFSEDLLHLISLG